MYPSSFCIINAVSDLSPEPAQRRCSGCRPGLFWLQLVVGFFLSAASGFAATITWGTPTTISSDTDVTNSGTLLYAFTGRTGATVNGVAFTAGNSGTTWVNVSLSGFGNDFPTVFGSGANVSPWSGLSSAYKTVLAGAAWGGASAGTVTLNGLTSGHSYLVQIWASDNRGGVEATRSEIANGGGTNIFAGQRTLKRTPNELKMVWLD